VEASPHRSVLVAEVVAFATGERDHVEPWVAVDATLGAGGHAEALLRRVGSAGRVLGLDRDPDALSLAQARLGGFGDRVRFVRAGFAELADVVASHGWGRVDAVIYDLGVSSMQLDRGERGFSFRQDAPLDMRMDPSGAKTAADVVNDYDQAELADVLFHYGDERHARRIAAAIVAARPIATTSELAAVIDAAMPAASKRDQHPARRSFQALRIEVNGELDQLEASLPQAGQVLAPGGRLVALSYHSLEDRVVKRALGEASRGETPRLRVLTKHPVTPSERELAENPRSSAAKLRAAERTGAPWGGDAA